MNTIIEEILNKYQIQRKIILLLYQTKNTISAGDLATYLNTTIASCSNITKKMKDNGILNYKVKGKYHFYYLSKEAINYLKENHPEIKPLENMDNNFDISLELRNCYIKAIELLKMPNYRNLLINSSLKEALIISFIIICYLENINYELEDIAELMNIKKLEVRSIYSKALIILKDILNNISVNLLDNNETLTNK